MEDLNAAFEDCSKRMIAYIAKIYVADRQLNNDDRTALIRSYASLHFILEVARCSQRLWAHAADVLYLASDTYYDREENEARRTVMGKFCDRCLFEIRAMAVHVQLDDEEYAYLRAICVFDECMLHPSSHNVISLPFSIDRARI